MKLIDKDALVAEIEKRIKVLQENPYENHKTICHLDSLKQSINSLEVKEVDLNKEIDNYFDDYKLAKKEECWLNHDQAHIFAKHFFELGVNASNPLTWEDIRLIAEIGDKFMNSEESDNLSEKDYYKEIFKRFKAQK